MKTDKRKSALTLLDDLNRFMRETKKTFRIWIKSDNTICVFSGKGKDRQRNTLYNFLAKNAYPIRDMKNKWQIGGAIAEQQNKITINQLQTALIELNDKTSNKLVNIKTLYQYVEQKQSEATNPKPYTQLLIWLQKASKEQILLTAFDVTHVKDFLRVLKKSELKPKTQRNIYSTLRAILNQAKKKDHLINENPTNELDKKDIPKINATTPKVEYLTQSEIAIIKDCYNKETNEQAKHALQIFLFQMYTGLRCGDILNLRWFNIDQKEMKATIKEQKTGKNNTFFISDIAQTLLPKFDKQNEFDRVFSYFNDDTTKAVPNINVHLKRYEKLIGGKHLHTHIARHTFATQILAQTKDLALVQSLLNHSNISTTSIYAKVLDTSKVEALKNFSNFVSTL